MVSDYSEDLDDVITSNYLPESAYRAFCENERLDALSDESVSDFKDRYVGEYEDMTDWAYSYVEDAGLLSEVPDLLQQYFDYESYGRDAELGGDLYTIATDSGTIWVFNS